MAAARTRRSGPALDELIAHPAIESGNGLEHCRSRQLPVACVNHFLRRAVVPADLLVPHFKRMFEEFELKLPAATQMLIHVSDALHWLLAYVALWLVPLAVVLSIVIWSGVLGGWFGAGSVDCCTPCRCWDRFGNGRQPPVSPGFSRCLSSREFRWERHCD